MGSVDNLWVMVFFIVVAITLVTTVVFWNILTTQATDLFDSSIGSDIQDNAQGMINSIDFYLLLGYLAVHLGIIITSFFLRSHPIGIILAVVLTLILIIVAVPLSNTWADLTADTTFSSAVVGFPITNHIILNLPLYEMLWGILNGIILYAFARTDVI